MVDALVLKDLNKPRQIWQGIMGSLPNLLTMGDMSLDGEDVVESHRQP